MWTILLASTFALLTSCNTAGKVNSGNTGDTAVLYKKDTLLITSMVPSISPFHFSAGAVQYNNRFKTFLILENPGLVSAPDGIYEIYITGGQPEKISQYEFVTVLDLYSLTAPVAKARVEIDISEHIKKIFLSKGVLLSGYFSIRFGPIKLPDETYSPKAGELHIAGYKIVQIDPG